MRALFSDDSHSTYVFSQLPRAVSPNDVIMLNRNYSHWFVTPAAFLERDGKLYFDFGAAVETIDNRFLSQVHAVHTVLCIVFETNEELSFPVGEHTYAASTGAILDPNAPTGPTHRSTRAARRAFANLRRSRIRWHRG